MSFLDAEFVLEGTPFTEADLKRARETWKWLDERYDLDWVSDPRGALAPDWNADTQLAACRLIHIAWVLHTLARNITQKSVAVFRRKVHALVEADASRVAMEPARQYEELLTELEVGALMSLRASPVALEPFVSVGAAEHEARESPDLAVRLPGGDVAIEVTVLYVGQLEAWERKVRELRDVLQVKIGRRGVFRDIEIGVPLTFSSGEASALTRRAVTEQIVRGESGRIVVRMKEGNAAIEWRTMPVYATEPSPSDVEPSVGGYAVASGGSLGSGASVRWRPAFGPTELEDRVFATLRNTLARKSAQFLGGTQYLLVLKPGHHRIPPEGLLELTSRRIWPNSLYSWVTGLMVYRPPVVGCQRTGRAWGEVSLNPNATPKATRSLEALLANQGQFHL